MYTALYRKWRPKAFSDVVGQDHITQTLKNEIKANRLSHAYLFVGTRGTGKTTCARIFAKALNCPHVVDGEPCNACEVCRSIDDGTALDITEIDAASNNGVDNIRELREEANFTPSELKYRIYILDEAHMLSAGAFNALLKILEEPPEHVKFILATTEAHKMLPTIRSRCQRFDFKRIGADDIADRLLYIAKQEGIVLTTEAAYLIARLSDGAMRDALSIMDQCIARQEDIVSKLVSEVCGIADKAYLAQTATALLEHDSAAVLNIIAGLHENACDMERYCAELINYFRNIMVARSVKSPEKLMVCSEDDMKHIAAFAERFTLPKSIMIINALQSTYAQIKSGVSGRTAMEMTLIKLADPVTAGDTDSILVRLAELEQAFKQGVTLAPAPAVRAQMPTPAEAAPAPPSEQAEPPAAPQPETEPEPEPDPAPQAQRTDAPTPIRQWPEILQMLFPKNRLVWTILNGTTARKANGVIIVDGKHPSIPDVLAVQMNADDVIEATQSVTGEAFRKVVDMRQAGDIIGAAPAAKAESSLDDFLQRAKENNIEIHYK